jgi:hypothetical protein
MPAGLGDDPDEAYLNALNTELLERLQTGGEIYISNALVDGVFLLRACVVNFRTTLADIEALPEIIVRVGREIAAEMQVTASD